MSNYLSAAQQAVYDAVKEGLPPSTICEKLGITIGILSAQVTRIRNKGIPIQLPDESRGIETAEDVIKDVEKFGPPNFDVEAAIKKATDGVHDMVLDVHPMVLFGITVQYMKMCGGRMHAHQMIEDIYQCLQIFVGDTSNDGGETKDLLNTVSEGDLTLIADKLDSLTKEVKEIIGAK